VGLTVRLSHFSLFFFWLITLCVYIENLTPSIELVGWSTSSLRRQDELPKVILKLFMEVWIVSGVNLTIVFSNSVEIFLEMRNSRTL
jgi:hypothetical protein